MGSSSKKVGSGPDDFDLRSEETHRAAGGFHLRSVGIGLRAAGSDPRSVGIDLSPVGIRLPAVDFRLRAVGIGLRSAKIRLPAVGFYPHSVGIHLLSVGFRPRSGCFPQKADRFGVFPTRVGQTPAARRPPTEGLSPTAAGGVPVEGRRNPRSVRRPPPMPQPEKAPGIISLRPRRTDAHSRAAGSSLPVMFPSPL